MVDWRNAIKGCMPNGADFEPPNFYPVSCLHRVEGDRSRVGNDRCPGCPLSLRSHIEQNVVVFDSNPFCGDGFVWEEGHLDYCGRARRGDAADRGGDVPVEIKVKGAGDPDKRREGRGFHELI